MQKLKLPLIRNWMQRPAGRTIIIVELVSEDCRMNEPNDDDDGAALVKD
jgi:hypothetical protein